MRSPSFLLLFAIIVAQLLTFCSAVVSSSTGTISHSSGVSATSSWGSSAGSSNCVGSSTVCPILDFLNNNQGLWVALTVPDGLLLAALGVLGVVFKRQLQTCCNRVKATEDTFNRDVGITPDDDQGRAATAGVDGGAELQRLKKSEQRDVAALSKRLSALESQLQAAKQVKGAKGVAPSKAKPCPSTGGEEDEKERRGNAGEDDDAVSRSLHHPIKLHTGGSEYHEEVTAAHPRPISAPPSTYRINPAPPRSHSRQGGDAPNARYLTLPNSSRQDGPSAHRRSQSNDDSSAALSLHHTINVVPWPSQESPQRLQGPDEVSFSPVGERAGPNFQETLPSSSRPPSPYRQVQQQQQTMESNAPAHWDAPAPPRVYSQPQRRQMSAQQSLGWQFSAPAAQQPYSVPPNSPASPPHGQPYPHFYPGAPYPPTLPAHTVVHGCGPYGGVGGVVIGPTSHPAPPPAAGVADGATTQQLMDLLAALLAQQQQQQPPAPFLPSSSVLQYAHSQPVQFALPPPQPMQLVQPAQPSLAQLQVQLQLLQQQLAVQQQHTSLTPRPLPQPPHSSDTLPPRPSALTLPVTPHSPPSPSLPPSPLVAVTAVSSPSNNARSNSADDVGPTWHDAEEDTH